MDQKQSNRARKKNHDFFKKILKIEFFKFRFFFFKLDLLFNLIIFSSKKIIKFYYKVITCCFFY